MPRAANARPSSAEACWRITALLAKAVPFVASTIGRHIAHRLGDYLASKFGRLVRSPTVPVGRTSPHVFVRDNIIVGIEQSLRLMKTDYLDVVQFHI